MGRRSLFFRTCCCLAFSVRCSAVGWSYLASRAALGLLLVGLLACDASGEDVSVPAGTCLVEMELPAGATVAVDGRDYGAHRRLTFDNLDPARMYSARLKITFRDGTQDERMLLIRGGQRVRVAASFPDSTRPELLLQTGHTGNVHSLAISRDGRCALTASADHTTILWDLATGSKLRMLEGSGSVAFSPDGRQALTGSTNRTVILWDLATGRKLRVLEGSSPLAISPDGRQALTANSKQYAFGVVLWDLATGTKVRAFEDQGGSISTIAFSPDGKGALVGSAAEEAVFWDLTNGTKHRTLPSPSGAKSVAIGPDGRQALVSSWKEVVLWDLADGQRLRTFPNPKNSAKSVAISPDGRQALAGYDDRTTVLWDLASGQRLRTMKGEGQLTVLSVAFSPDGRQALTSQDSNCAPMLWDLATGEKIRSLEGRIDRVWSVALSPDGRQVMSISGFASPVPWDLVTGRMLHVAQHPDIVASIGISPDGRYAMAGSADASASLWEPASDRGLRTIRGSSEGDEFYMPTISPDGRRALTLDMRRRTVFLWDLTGGKKLRTLPKKEGMDEVSAMVFSPDGRQALIGFSLGTTVLWNLNTGKRLHVLQGESTWGIDAVAFSPDGRRAMTGSRDYTAAYWDLTAGRRLHLLQGHRGDVESVAIGPDGRQALTASADHTAILWDLATGQQLRVLEGHSAEVTSVAMSSDGARAMTGSLDGTMRLWELGSGDELARLLTLERGRDWLVVTPQGLFDGSVEGRRRVSFRVGGGLSIAPVDRFFQDFFRPGLLGALWRGEQPVPEIQLGRSLPPIVRILSPRPGDVESPEVTVEVEVTDQGGGISGPTIYHNGARVLAEGESRRTGKILRRTFRVVLVEGPNRLAVKAASLDGSWEAEPAEVVVRYEKLLAKSRLFLVAVGVSRYADANLKLDFAAKDARAIAELFRRHGKRLYEEVRVREILDQQATRAEIQNALREVAAQTRPQDTFVLFLAGHGALVNQRYFFVPCDLRPKARRLEDDLREQGLSADELTDCLGGAKAIKRVLVLDTCASGGAIGVLLKGRGFALRGTIERLSRTQGLFIIAAASAGQEAQESTELGHGILTYALLAGFKGVDRGPLEGKAVQPISPDHVVDVSEWFNFAASHVPRLTEKLYGAAHEVPLGNDGQVFPLLPLEE